jgi:hypothetical protein
MGAKYLMQEPSIFDIDYHFVRERVAKKLLDVRFISSQDQVADGFTKALAVEDLGRFRRNLNLVTLRLSGAQALAAIAADSGVPQMEAV